jgi:Tol biopolymer transport system component
MQGHGSFPAEGVVSAADGTAPRVLPDLRTPLSLDAQFRRFAMLSGAQPWSLAVEDVDSGIQRTLAVASTTAWPVWSPRADRIAFAAAAGTPAVVDADGSNLRGLPGPTAPTRALWWSPDGGAVAVWAGPYQNGTDLWILPADGSPGVRVASDRSAYTAAWSPDGAQLAYVAASGADERARLFLASRDGTRVESLASDVLEPIGLGGSPSSALSWSPDGTKIVYAGLLGVTVYDIATGLGRTIASGYDPVWSPDGTTIAFADWGGCDRSGIVLSAPDGTDWRKLTSDCRIYGTAGPDRLAGTDFVDQIYGGDGNDVIDGGWGYDVLYGGAGNDHIVGGPGVDVAYGGPGDDTIDANTIYGGAGRDRISVAGDYPAFIFAVDGERDVVSCGRSRNDRVYADPIDRVGRSCEHVYR